MAKSNEEVFRMVVKAYAQGSASLELESDFGKGYVRAMQVMLEEIERQERIWQLPDVTPRKEA